MASEPTPSARPPSGGIAFLLAQLGSHATSRYAEAVARLDLTPAQTGVLTLLAREPAQSQQALSVLLGVVPSAVVPLVDGLEARGLVERRRGANDRRLYELHLTQAGQALLAGVRAVAIDHEAAISGGLSDAERRDLATLLRKIADVQGLAPGVHPGYRVLPGREPV